MFLKSCGIEAIKPGVRKKGNQNKLDYCRKKGRGSGHYWKLLTNHENKFKIGYCLKKFFKKVIFKDLTDSKFSSFHQKSINALSHDSIEKKEVCHAWLINELSQ